MTKQLAPRSPRCPAPAVRQRLPPDIRIQQILDVALEAFARDGYAATRIDDIAQRAGLSKGGVYAHFKSKEEIFEALLSRTLAPKSLDGLILAPAGSVTVPRVVERIVDRMYVDLCDPRTVLTLRMLLADGIRVPERVGQWRRMVIEPYLKAIETLLRQGVADGTLRKSILAEAPWLVLAPAVFAAMWQLVFEDATPASLDAQRRAHIALVKELLGPEVPRETTHGDGTGTLARAR